MPSPPTASLRRRAAAEALGTGLLVTVVVGSGISAQQLSSDPGVRLIINALATVAGLAVAILVVGPVSGAHLNPVVTAVNWWLRRGDANGLSASEMVVYAGAQVSGGLAGVFLAHAMFGLDLTQRSTHARSSGHLWLAEAVATAGLVLVVVALSRSATAAQTAWAVGAYIGAAYFFTSSTSFANPAVTLARTATDTFSGVAFSSAPAFVAAQILGGTLGAAVAVGLYPDSAGGAVGLPVRMEHSEGEARG